MIQNESKIFFLFFVKKYNKIHQYIKIIDIILKNTEIEKFDG